VPKSSELFPLNKGIGSGGTVVDDSPPKIILLDNPFSTIENGVLSISVRTLVIDDGGGTVNSSTPPASQKPTASWVSASAVDATTLGGVVKVQLKIEDPAGASKPTASWVGVSGSGGTTLGESPVKIQLRISE
jgi:hypothetical protein